MPSKLFLGFTFACKEAAVALFYTSALLTQEMCHGLVDSCQFYIEVSQTGIKGRWIFVNKPYRAGDPAAWAVDVELDLSSCESVLFHTY